MIFRIFTFVFIAIVFVSMHSFFDNTDEAVPPVWKAGPQLLGPGPAGSFDEVAVKDPSIVYFDNQWHLFYTARSQAEYTTGYVAAVNLEDLKSAPHHELKMIRGKSRYGCAPQVFYYQPQNKWYLVFQNRDSNYQPAFSTTSNLNAPSSWSDPVTLLKKDEKEKWIDFWIIGDKDHMYLFYTRLHRDIMIRTTTRKAFPEGWGPAQKVFSGVHEAVHIYKAKGKGEYHMVYELNDDGERSFGLATARDLSGPWNKVTDEYATGGQIQYGTGQPVWTEMVSHGEAIRTGYDEFMEYDPDGGRWIIQGLKKSELTEEYVQLPWKLGVITGDMSRMK